MGVKQAIKQGVRGLEAEHVNVVRLVGRLGGEAEARELPSGDTVVSLRVVVDRPAAAVRGRVRVDTVDCAVWSAALRRRVAAWRVGDVVEVEGGLRRRFYRVGGTAVSRVEVEVVAARLVRRAAVKPVTTPRRARTG